MMAFPTALSIRIVLLALSPHQAVSYSLILISVTVTFAYFFKVSRGDGRVWSAPHGRSFFFVLFLLIYVFYVFSGIMLLFVVVVE